MDNFCEVFVSATEFCRNNKSQQIKSQNLCDTLRRQILSQCKISPVHTKRFVSAMRCHRDVLLALTFTQGVICHCDLLLQLIVSDALNRSC